jgi:hypothetical protein
MSAVCKESIAMERRIRQHDTELKRTPKTATIASVLIKSKTKIFAILFLYVVHPAV